MKKYMAPEMEIAKFKMEDAVTTSVGGDTPVPTVGLDNTNPEYQITGDRSEYIY